MLNENEFLIMKELMLLSPEAIDWLKVVQKTNLSLETINSTINVLRKRKLIKDNSLTEYGIKELNYYKVENAIIMAAGKSSRFVPLSYEKPKGMLQVKDEILIEREIEQLLDAGITNITVVVGYMKESFFISKINIMLKSLLMRIIIVTIILQA